MRLQPLRACVFVWSLLSLLLLLTRDQTIATEETTQWRPSCEKDVIHRLEIFAREEMSRVKATPPSLRVEKTLDLEQNCIRNDRLSDALALTYRGIQVARDYYERCEHVCIVRFVQPLLQTQSRLPPECVAEQDCCLVCRTKIVVMSLPRVSARLYRSAVTLRKGASPLSMGSLCGVGDLVLTCTGSLSRNWTVGNRLAKGEVRDHKLWKTPP